MSPSIALAVGGTEATQWVERGPSHRFPPRHSAGSLPRCPCPDGAGVRVGELGRLRAPRRSGRGGWFAPVVLVRHVWGVANVNIDPWYHAPRRCIGCTVIAVARQAQIRLLQFFMTNYCSELFAYTLIIYCRLGELQQESFNGGKKGFLL